MANSNYLLKEWYDLLKTFLIYIISKTDIGTGTENKS